MRSWALFATGLGAAIAFWPGILGAALAPRWAFLAVAIPLCFLFTRFSLPEAFLAVVALAAAALSLLWAPDQLGALDELAHLVILGAAFTLGASVSSLRPVWIGAALGVVVSAFIGLAQLAGWTGVEQAVAPAGLFMNRNMLAEAGLVIAAAGVGLAWAPGVAAGALAAAVGGSKAVGVALALLLAWSLHRRQPTLAAMVAGGAVAAALLAFVVGMPSAVERLGFWETAAAGVTPLGNGLASFSLTHPFAGFAHNEPLHFAYELGALALVPAALIFYALGGGRDARTELLVVLAVGAVALLSFPLHMPFTAFAAALACGHLARLRRMVGRFGDAGRVPAGVGA